MTAPRGWGALTLTDQQRRIVRRLRDGMTTKDAAAEMGISRETAMVHLKRARKKHGCQTTTQLVAMAVDKRWLDRA